ncbi:MAG: DNA polymerase III subunit delta [Erysipelotrichales bacterium]|nr:DNA polymerase III subunit delta [Erysipelotrichales bacterium]
MNYILYGEESYLIKKRIKEIAREILKEAIDELEYYDLNQTSLFMIFDEAKVLPLFSEQKVMVVENCEFLKSGSKKDEGDSKGSNALELMQEEVGLPNETTTLIFVVDGNLDTRKTIIKDIMKKCKCEQYNKLDDNDRKQYITTFLKANNISLEPSLKSYLIEILPNDMYLMKNELEKLALYGDAIDKTIINSLISRPLEDDVFLWTNAIMKKDTKRVFSIWQDLKKANKEVLQLMGLLASQFRFCYQCISLKKLGYSNDDIAAELACKSTRVKITLESVRGRSQDYFLGLLNKLSELDNNIKSGKIDKILGFELFLLEVGGNK